MEEKQITIQFNQVNQDEKVDFALKNRKTNEVVALCSERNGNQFVIEYNTIELPETDFTRYNLVYSTLSEQFLRPQIKNEKMSLKSINKDTFFFTNEKDGFRFYFTDDNKVSLTSGNYLNVEREFKQVRKVDIPVETVDYSDNLLKLGVKCPNENEQAYVAWKEEKNRYILDDSAFIEREGNQFIIKIDQRALSSIGDVKNITPKVVFIQDSVLYEGRLTTELDMVDEQVDAHVGLFCYRDEGAVKLTTDLNLFKKILNVEKQQWFIKSCSFSATQLTIDLTNQINQPENIFIYREDISNDQFSLVNEFDIVDSSRIKIKLEENDFHSKCFRYVFAKKHDQPENGDSLSISLADMDESILVSNYECFRLYNEKLHKSNLKSKKFRDYIEIDAETYLLSFWSAEGELIFQTVTPQRYRELRYEDFKVNFSAIYFKESFGKIQLKLDYINLDSTSKFNFYLKARKTKQIFNIGYEIDDDQKITLNFIPFLDELELESSRWDMFVELYQQESYLHGKLGQFSSSVVNKFDRYFTSISNGANKNNFSLVPYLSVKNELAFIWNDIDKIRNEQLEHDIKVTSSKVRSNEIKINAEISKIGVADFEIATGMIKLRNKAIVKEYDVPIEIISKSADSVNISMKIKPKSYHLLPFYWDVYVVLKVGNERFPLRLKHPTKTIKRDIGKKISQNEIDVVGGYMIYPYITVDNSYALCYRERKPYENKVNRFKENLAYLTYRLFKKHFDKKKIWIGYEKESSVAQDNGYQFFNYCYNNKKKKDYYFVIKSDAPDYQDIKQQKDKILKFMSFKYMIYMFAAELMISSESKGHSYDIRIQKGRLSKALKKKPFIFLQHGVIALKRVDYVFNKRRNNEISLFTVSSDFEKEIIKNNFGYKDSEVIVTGLTRWDVLKDKSAGEDKKIFVMPTWRSWMDGIPEEEFIASNYFKQYRELLESKELNDILTQNNLTLHFLLHPKFSEYSDKFTVAGDRIITHQFGDIKINEMLMESSLLITDYSSVSFEFFYMQKPVIFFQFDREDYDRYQGSYMDFDTDLFGDSVDNVDNLLERVSYYVGNGFSEMPQYASLRNKYFKYVDHNNSQRTFEEVRKYEKTLK